MPNKQYIFTTDDLRRVNQSLHGIDNDTLNPTMWWLYRGFLKDARKFPEVTDYMRNDPDHFLIINGKIVIMYYDVATDSPHTERPPYKDPHPKGIFISGERKTTKMLRGKLEAWVIKKNITEKEVKKRREEGPDLGRIKR